MKTKAKKEVTLLKKVEAANKIVACNNKIKYYKSAIAALTKDKSKLHDSTISVRVTGIKNNFWETLTADETVQLFKRKLRQEQTLLAQL